MRKSGRFILSFRDTRGNEVSEKSYSYHMGAGAVKNVVLGPVSTLFAKAPNSHRATYDTPRKLGTSV